MPLDLHRGIFDLPTRECLQVYPDRFKSPSILLLERFEVNSDLIVFWGGLVQG
jgi:hypothetical protein